VKLPVETAMMLASTRRAAQISSGVSPTKQALAGAPNLCRTSATACWKMAVRLSL
jgi:hypothetical protein